MGDGLNPAIAAGIQYAEDNNGAAVALHFPSFRQVLAFARWAAEHGWEEWEHVLELPKGSTLYVLELPNGSTLYVFWPAVVRLAKYREFGFVAYHGSRKKSMGGLLLLASRLRLSRTNTGEHLAVSTG